MFLAKYELIEYAHENSILKHYVIYLENKRVRYLHSFSNLWLMQKESINSSRRYSRVLCVWFNYLQTIRDDGENGWVLAKETDLRAWQGDRVKKRDKEKALKPSDKTIHEEAVIVHDFYKWAKSKGAPITIVFTSSQSSGWQYDFTDSLLNYVRGPHAGSAVDHKVINTSKKRQLSQSYTIMSNGNIKTLMQAYSDSVYRVALLLALATGMRAEGVCQMPYIGKGKNSHIRTYPDILSTIDDAESKTFSFDVYEKGKYRTLSVNMKAWACICENYLPEYYRRKKLFEEKYPSEDSSSVFFLTKKGDPLTPKKLADMTNIAKRKLGTFPWTFHSSRGWYATKFLIMHLSEAEINGSFYDAAVEEALRLQLGHEDIQTTYKHYIKVASLVLSSAKLRGLSVGDDMNWNEVLT